MLAPLGQRDDFVELGWFTERLASFGDLTAMVWRNKSFSFSLLLKKSEIWLRHLKDAGIPRGSCVAIVGDFSPGTCSLLLALIRGEYVAVPISRRFFAKSPETLETACVKYVVEFDNYDEYVGKIIEKPNQNALIKKLVKDNDPGLVLFTSGSSGYPKAVLHSFKKLLKKSRRPSSGKITLTFLLLEHIGGIDTLLHLFAIGGTAVCIGNREPETVCRAIKKYKVDFLPTTATFLRMLLLSKVYEKFDLSSLEMISYGSEPMPASLLASLVKILPQIKFKQSYGITELGALPTKSRANDSTWFSIDNKIETKIEKERLWIRNDSAMLGYLNSDSNFDSDGWYDTGDRVIQEGEFIKILGRESELINVGGEKVFPIEIESTILEIPEVSDVTISGKENAVMGNVVMAKIKITENAEKKGLVKKIRAHCIKRLDASFKVPAIITISEIDLHGDRFKKLRVNVDE